jgi:acyl-CoA synthetase (AMP-forming)/AMP-acid ligase II
MRVTVAEPTWLLSRLSEFGPRDAIVYRDRTLTYSQLGDGITEWQRRLDEKGLVAGSVVALRGDYSPAICALFLALVTRRGVAAVLPPGGQAEQHLVAAYADALVDFERSGSWTYMPPSPGPPPAVLRRLRDRGTAGLVVFTSGTTGQDKAALFDFDALVDRYREARSGYRTQVFLMLDHLGGIHTMLHTLAHGGTLVISEERQPAAVARAIERHRVELLPATPTFLRMLVLSRAHERYDLSSLRLITYGTEPMPSSTLEALGARFPACASSRRTASPSSVSCRHGRAGPIPCGWS